MKECSGTQTAKPHVSRRTPGVVWKLIKNNNFIWFRQHVPFMKLKFQVASYRISPLTLLPGRRDVLFMSMGWDYVSELRQPTGILFITQMICVYGGMMEWHDGMIFTGETRRTRRKTCPSATSSTTNSTRTDPGANPGFRGERQHDVTEFLSPGVARLLDSVIYSKDRKSFAIYHST
jgi:hypothetical protein